MKAIALAIAALAALATFANDSAQEVRIPFDGEQSKYVTFYEAPTERGLTRFSKEDGEVRLEWLERTKISKAIFSAPLFEGILADLRKKDLQPVEFVVGIRYDGADLPKLETYLFTKSRQVKPFYFCLKQGYSEYSVKHDELTNLDQYQIRGGAKQFTVEKLAFKVMPKAETYRKLELGVLRKTFEVLPGGGTLTDFIWRPESAGTESDVKLNIKIADGALQFRSEAAMPETPVANVKQRDGAVFWDDALEIFLSPQLDNRSYSQITINAANTIYDAEYSYDPVAAKWKHRKEVNYDFRSSARHENGILNIDADLPLTVLKFDPKKCPLLAFQAGFNRNFPKAYYSWKPFGEMNMVPRSYGMLYFNAQPFGSGELKFTAATLAESSRRLQLAAEGANFPEPAYDVEIIVTAPDFSVERYPMKQISLNGKVNLEIPGIKDYNGVYSVILSVKNSRKAVRPFVVNFTNVKPVSYPYGQKRIYPYPKQLKWTDGYFKAGDCSTLDLAQGATARTRRTAELLRDKLSGFGLDYQITEDAGKGIMLRIQPDGLQPEGYRLKVTSGRIELIGADERGLYYATVTLHQLMNMEMKPCRDVPVPCVEIVDAPDLKNRMAPFWFPDQIGMPIKERATMDFFLDYIDRFVAGNKMNVLKVRGIETLIQYDGEDLPNLAKLNYNPKARFLTWADLERLAKFCDDRFIDLMVTLPAGGHDYWISQFAGYREKGWDTGDVSHPDYEKIYFAIADKMIKHTGCRYFTADSDEWWHERNPREEQEDTIRGRPRAQVFLDFHLKLHDFLKERGVRMAMNEDMINPAHNGPRFDTWKIVDSLPRDIVILVWADLGNALKYFGEKGFECWGQATGWITFNQPERKYVTGYGASLYGFGREWKLRLVESFSFHSIWFLGANYAWNFNNRTQNWNYADWMNSGELAAAESVFAASANPCGGETFEPLDLNQFFNASAPMFADGSTMVCNIPMRLGKSSEKNCVETGKDKPQTISVNKKCSSLVFLHTAIPGETYKKSRNGYGNRMWQRGYPVAEYTVVYGDGTQDVYPVHVNQEIYFEDWQPQAGSTVFGRGMKICYDADRKPHFAYQWEWVNPHPEKEIAEVRVSVPNQWDFTHRLLALTLRDVRKR